MAHTGTTWTLLYVHTYTAYGIKRVQSQKEGRDTQRTKYYLLYTELSTQICTLILRTQLRCGQRGSSVSTVHWLQLDDRDSISSRGRDYSFRHQCPDWFRGPPVGTTTARCHVRIAWSHTSTPLCLHGVVLSFIL